MSASPSATSTRPPAVLLVLLIAFVGAMAYLIAASMVPRDVPTFMPSAFDAGDGDGELGDRRVDTVTFDARDAERWHYFSLSRGVPLVPPDTAGWEVAVRRYHLVVPGAAADMGPVEFASVDAVPDSGFVMPDGRDDAGHPAIRRWYRYGMFTHLLESKQHVYAARMSDGTYAALQVLSYYCPGPRPGCLTIRYRRPLSGEHRADGSPRRRRDLASDAEP